MFLLTDHEKSEVVENFRHLEKIGFSPVLPQAFTLKGCYMLATVLNGDNAIDTTVEIIEAFEKLPELLEIIKRKLLENDCEELAKIQAESELKWLGLN